MADDLTSGCPSTDDCLLSFLILFDSYLLSSALKQGIQNVFKTF